MMDAAPTAQLLAGLDWPHRTERLILRRATADDADAVFDYRSRPDVARWLSRIQTDPQAWAREWELRRPMTLIVERDGHVLGDLRIAIGDAHSQTEVLSLAEQVEGALMWCFHPDHCGHGYATEAVNALVQIAFEELALRRLTAVCYADNRPSWRLMERVGMRREGHSIRSTLHRDGSWRDFFTYALLAPGE